MPSLKTSLFGHISQTELTLVNRGWRRLSGFCPRWKIQVFDCWGVWCKLPHTFFLLSRQSQTARFLPKSTLSFIYTYLSIPITERTPIIVTRVTDDLKIVGGDRCGCLGGCVVLVTI